MKEELNSLKEKQLSKAVLFVNKVILLRYSKYFKQKLEHISDELININKTKTVRDNSNEFSVECRQIWRNKRSNLSNDAQLRENSC